MEKSRWQMGRFMLTRRSFGKNVLIEKHGGSSSSDESSGERMSGAEGDGLSVLHCT